MTQEQKDILLKDLCARLPYGVKVQAFDYDGIETVETLYQIDSDGCTSTIECDTLKYAQTLSLSTFKYDRGNNG